MSDNRAIDHSNQRQRKPPAPPQRIDQIGFNRLAKRRFNDKSNRRRIPRSLFTNLNLTGNGSTPVVCDPSNLTRFEPDLSTQVSRPRFAFRTEIPGNCDPRNHSATPKVCGPVAAFSAVAPHAHRP